MISLFNELLLRPLFNLTVFLYDVLPGSDFGLAIIFLTIMIKIIFLPLTIKTLRSQKAINQINPEVKKIKDKFKNDKAAQSAAILQLYKDNNINPVAGCLPLLIQIPILIGLYRAFIAGFEPESLNLLYSFINNPGQIEKISFGIVDVSSSSPILAVVAATTQFFQMKHSIGSMTESSGQTKEMQVMSRQMLYFFPIIIIIIGWSLPAGLMFYWITTTLVSVIEQTYIKKLK
jgi:YidC/Oxa1 family membrane protein insertase